MTARPIPPARPSAEGDPALSWFRYVRHADVPAFIARGWAVCADLGPVHGFWSVLMRWMGAGEPA